MKKYIKLNEAFEFIRNGVSIKQSDGAGGYPITRIETIANGYVDSSRMGYADIQGLEKYEDYILKKGDILMSHINSEKHLGKSALYVDDTNEVIHGMNLLGLRCKKDILLPEYAFHYFNSELFKRQIPRIMKKSVNQASFSVTDLKQLTIFTLSINEQQKIATILDKAQSLIDKRKEQIEACDELVKSLFYDMFYDSKIKEFNRDYKWSKLKELCENITKGTTPKYGDIYNEEFEESIPFLKVYHITNKGEIDFTYKPSYITRETHDIALTRSKVYPNDVIMNIVGPPLGKIALIPKIFNEYNINQAMAIFRVKGQIVPRYLLHCLKSERILKDILSLSVGIRQQNISLEQCRNIQIPLPPLHLQNKFAAQVEKIEQQKQLLEQSLAELENNFNSLMQRAFKGELF